MSETLAPKQILANVYKRLAETGKPLTETEALDLLAKLASALVAENFALHKELTNLKPGIAWGFLRRSPEYVLLGKSRAEPVEVERP